MQCYMNGRFAVARSFGRMYSRMWEPDGKFVALSGLEQRLYQFLNSQSELTHAGTLPITLRRWAKTAKDLTPKQIEQQLRALEDAGFLVIDFDEDELLIRRHILDDEVYKQPRVMGSAVASAMRVRSRKLRRVLAEELEEISTEELNDKPARDGSPSVREQVESHIISLRVALRADLPADSPLQRYRQDPAQPPRQPPAQVPAEPLPESPAEGVAEPPAHPLPQGIAHPLPEPLPEGVTQGSAQPLPTPSTRVRAPGLLETSSSSSSSSSPKELIRAARVVEEDEEDRFLAWIRTAHRPGSSAWWRTVAANGDLPDLADQWRATLPTRPTQARRCPVHKLEYPCRSCAADTKAAPDEDWPPPDDVNWPPEPRDDPDPDF